MHPTCHKNAFKHAMTSNEVTMHMSHLPNAPASWASSQASLDALKTLRLSTASPTSSKRILKQKTPLDANPMVDLNKTYFKIVISDPT